MIFSLRTNDRFHFGISDFFSSEYTLGGALVFRKSKRRKRVRHVLDVAKMASLVVTVPLADTFPAMAARSVKERDFERWGFFSTVAAFGAGMFLAHARIPATDLDERLETERAVAHVLNEWDGQGYQAYTDFVQFVSGSTEKGIETEHAAGAWLLTNIKGSQPTKDEFKAGVATGPVLFATMKREVSWE